MGVLRLGSMGLPGRHTKPSACVRAPERARQVDEEKLVNRPWLGRLARSPAHRGEAAVA